MQALVEGGCGYTRQAVGGFGQVAGRAPQGDRGAQSAAALQFQRQRPFERIEQLLSGLRVAFGQRGEACFNRSPRARGRTPARSASLRALDEGRLRFNAICRIRPA
jgi:hypothetical protein